jgi:hypothetical protein
MFAVVVEAHFDTGEELPLEEVYCLPLFGIQPKLSLLEARAWLLKRMNYTGLLLLETGLELANSDAAECSKHVGKGQSYWRKHCKLPAKTLQALGFHLSRPKMKINLSSLLSDGVKTGGFKYSLLDLPG